MIKNKIVLVCDHCGKELEYEDTMYFGGHPSNGWIDIHVRGGSTQLANLKRQKDSLFCGRECLRNWCEEG